MPHHLGWKYFHPDLVSLAWDWHRVDFQLPAICQGSRHQLPSIRSPARHPCLWDKSTSSWGNHGSFTTAAVVSGGIYVSGLSGPIWNLDEFGVFPPCFHLVSAGKTIFIFLNNSLIMELFSCKINWAKAIDWIKYKAINWKISAIRTSWIWANPDFCS